MDIVDRRGIQALIADARAGAELTRDTCPEESGSSVSRSDIEYLAGAVQSLATALEKLLERIP